MDVSKYQFDDDEIDQLHKCRDNQPDIRLKVRFMALLMLAQGVEFKMHISLEKKQPILLISDYVCGNESLIF